MNTIQITTVWGILAKFSKCNWKEQHKILCRSVGGFLSQLSYLIKNILFPAILKKVDFCALQTNNKL